MDFKLQIVANEQEVDLLANCSLLPVLSRLNNSTKIVKSMRRRSYAKRMD